MSVASETNIAESWLSKVPSPTGLVDTGTPAISADSGSPPISRRYERSAPATSARTRSLNVTSCRIFSCSRSSKATDAKESARSGPIDLLNDVAGARNNMPPS